METALLYANLLRFVHRQLVYTMQLSWPISYSVDVFSVIATGRHCYGMVGLPISMVVSSELGLLQLVHRNLSKE